MPLFWISLAFLGGILIAKYLSISILGWILLTVAAIVLSIPPVFQRISARFSSRLSQASEALRLSTPLVLPLMFAALCLGAIRYQLNQPKIDPSFIAYYNDQATEYVIEAVVAEPPDQRDTYANLRLRVEQLRPVDVISFSPVKGLLLARVPASSAFVYGDRIVLQGYLQTPPENEDFSYRDYLANHGVYSYMAFPATSLLIQNQGNPIYAFIYRIRQGAVSLVYSLYPDPEASLLAGILLGDQSGIPEGVQEAFRLTGTSHIIVISGFNITIIAGLFTKVFSRLLGQRKGAVAAAIGIGFYTLLVGANAAVLRAAILGVLTLLGHQVGRRQVGLNSLAFVAGVMAVFTPGILWDVSFQLSFAATLGIMLYAEPFSQWFTNLAARVVPREKALRLASPVSAYFLLTLAAQLTTLPLIIYYFKRFSLSAILANPLILPAQPPLMVLGGLSVLTGIVFKPLGQLFAWAAWPFTAYTIRVVEWLAGIRGGSVATGQIALPAVLLFFAVLLVVTFAHSRIRSLTTHLTPGIGLATLSIVTVLVWKAGLSAPDGLLHVTVLDVGTGDAVLIQSPTGRVVLINGGQSTVRLSDALGRQLPLFNRKLDWLVIADIDNEDLSGVTGNLERFTPANALWAGNTYGTRSSSDLWSGLVSKRISTTIMEAGQVLELGSGASLRVISVDERGAVLLLAWNDFRMLLPMGMDFAAIDKLQKDSTMRNISAMLLAESGYAPLNPPELISFLNPQLSSLSVAPGDKTGLPSPETLEALEGYNLFRTDVNGWIEITTGGKQMWVEVERK